jgi:2,3-bisphosphoglycerate-independent phosphoglycerate mutase
MLKKAVLLIFDGLGDRPVPELDNLTPLERANTPNLDRLAQEGICGLMSTLGVGNVPGSDTAHLTIFGYNINEYYPGRGPVEVAGLGFNLKHGDVALRANLGTVDDTGTIIDRRAGRITDVREFVEEIKNIEIDGVEFIALPGTAHRVGLIMRGKGLSAQIKDPDPHAAGEKVRMPEPLDNSPEAKFTAQVLTKYLARTHEILKASVANKERIKQGLLPANYVLARGAGYYRAVPDFQSRYGLKACAIAGGGLYKGLGRYVGMDVINVPGATALPNTDVRAKFSKVLECLQTYDFVYVHVKATDSLGEDGNFLGKTSFLEKADQAVELLFDLPKDTLLVVTGDHSTPCSLKHHSADPVPVLMHGQDVRVDNIREFGERACARGGLGKIQGIEIMPEIKNLLGESRLIGD